MNALNNRRRYYEKITYLFILLALIFSLAICVHADGQTDVFFTSDSSFVVGGTATVDLTKTAQSVMSDGAITSDMYNAALERNMYVSWVCSNGPNRSGTSVTWTNADLGKEYVCRVSFYADKELTESVGFIDGQPFVVSAAASSKSPTITTTSVPDGVVGEYYYVKLACDDPDATFSLFRSSLPDGMYLTQHGEIEGTPTKAGQCHINVVVKNEAGIEDSFGFDFIIEEKASCSMEVTKAPNKVTYKVGEKLDMKGLKVRIYMPDGFKDLTDGDGLTYYTGELKTVGEQKIKLSYEDAFEYIIVTVVAADEEETEVTEPTETTDPEETTESDQKDQEEETQDEEEESSKTGKKRKARGEDGEEADMTWLIIALGCAVAAAVAITVVVIIKKKKQ